MSKYTVKLEFEQKYKQFQYTSCVDLRLLT